MRQKYQCIECDHIFNGHPIMQDGTSCPLCSSYASPIGPADPELDKKVSKCLLNVQVDIINTEVYKEMLAVTLLLYERADEATKADVSKEIERIKGLSSG